jgi:hypothetical protein
LATVSEDIINWSKKFVEKISDINDMPVCPYARGCRIKKTFKVEEVSSKEDLLNLTVQWCNKIKKTKYQIVVIGCTDLSISAEQLDSSVEAFNYAYMPKDIYLMASHHDQSGEVDFLYDNDFETDNEFSMILIQRLAELEKASQNLKKKGYYKNWDKEYYKHTVQTRKNLIRSILS